MNLEYPLDLNQLFPRGITNLKLFKMRLVSLFVFFNLLSPIYSQSTRSFCDQKTAKDAVGGFNNYYASNSQNLDSVYTAFQECFITNPDPNRVLFLCELGSAWLLDEFRRNGVFDIQNCLYLEKIASKYENFQALAILNYVKTRMQEPQAVDSNLKLYRKSLAFIKLADLEDSYLTARLYHNIGNQLFHLSRSGWESFFEKSIELKIRLDRPERAAFSSAIYAERLIDRGKRDASLRALEAAGELITNSTDTSSCLVLYNVRGNILDRLAEFDLAIDSYEKAIEMCDGVTKSSSFCDQCFDATMSRLVKASNFLDLHKMEELMELLAQFLDPRDYQRSAKYLLAQGQISLRKGALKEALVFAEAGERRIKSNPNFDPLDVNNIEALIFKEIVFSQLGLSEQAKKSNQDLIKYFTETGNYSRRSTSAGNLAASLVENGELDEAREFYLLDSLKMNRDFFYYYNRSSLELQGLNFETAIVFIDSALFLSPSPERKSDVLRLAAQAFRGNGQIDKALEACDEAINVLNIIDVQKSELPENILQLSGEMVQVMTLNAELQFSKFQSSGDTKWKVKCQQSLTDLEAQLNYVQDLNFGRKRILDGYNRLSELKLRIELLWKAGGNQGEKVVEAIELCKSNVLLSQRAKMNYIEQKGRSPELDRYVELFQRQVYLKKRIESKGPNLDDEITELTNIIPKINAAWEELMESDPDFLLPRSSIERGRIEELYKKLDSEEAAMIQIKQLDDKLIVSWISNYECSFNILEISEDSINDLSSSFLEYIDLRQEGDRFKELALKLGGILPSELLQDPGIQSLIISADGPLQSLPFEAFILDTASNRYLSDVIDVHYAFSIEDYSGIEFELPNSSTEIFGFAPDYSAQNYSDIDGFQNRWLFQSASGLINSCRPLKNLQELEIAQSNFQGEYFTGLEASEENLAKVREVGILLLSMHGFNYNEDPDLSGMIFQDAFGEMDSIGDLTIRFEQFDGILHAFEIYQRPIQTELTILSACQTGTGVIEPGEGVNSLARAFKASGSQNVVMSLWKVDDDAGLEIMNSFFGFLSKGYGKATALSNAKAEFRKNNPSAPPYYWAGFVLVGDNSPLTFVVAFERQIWLLFGFVFLGVIMLFAYKKTRGKTA